MIKALVTFLEQVIELSIVRGTEKKWVALHCHEASHDKAHQDSKGMFYGPSLETSEKESKIDLKKKITLHFQTFEPDPLSFHGFFLFYSNSH